jgi:hypothetical protein
MSTVGWSESSFVSLRNQSLHRQLGPHLWTDILPSKGISRYEASEDVVTPNQPGRTNDE